MQSYYCLQMTIVFLKCNILLSCKLLKVTSMKFAQAKRCPLQEQILCTKVHFIVSNDALNDCIDDIFIIFVKKKYYLIFFSFRDRTKVPRGKSIKKSKDWVKEKKDRRRRQGK